ncbi:NAD-dependent epimerase/dehydratase family protein [Paenibacillus tarimensis]
MRILIIGGTSFIGPHVVQLLYSMGHQVAVFHRGRTSIHFPNSIHLIIGDRNNLNHYSEEFVRFSPDVVLDMIPSTEEQAKSLVHTFTGITQRIVAISSQDVYRAYGLVRGIETGGLEAIPITENSRLRQRLYPYRDTAKDNDDWSNKYDKMLVERTILGASSLAGTILRLSAVYGPRDNQHRFFSYLNLKRMIDKRPFILMEESFADWRWTHAYVENVALAVVLAVLNDRSAGRIYNVGELSTPSMIEFVKEIADRLGWNGDIVLLPKEKLSEQLLFPLDTAQQLVVDSNLIREELGYREKISWGEGINRTIEWELENLPAKADPKYHLHFDYEKEDQLLKEMGFI